MLTMRPLSIISLALACFALSMCASRYGSVGEYSVRETLASPHLALTPHEPRWLLKDSQVHSLSAAQSARVRELLMRATVREVAEEYYREERQGNRGDSSSRIFYLYAGNGQSLGGRVVDNKVLMDDFDLSAEQSEELYTLFAPALRKILK